jgi:hypothetical protein
VNLEALVEKACLLISGALSHFSAQLNGKSMEFKRSGRFETLIELLDWLFDEAC